MEHRPIPQIKKPCNGKSDEDYFKLKYFIDPTYSTSDPYVFNMSLFVHGDPEEFILFICYFNMTLAETGTLEMETKIQYLHMLVRR